MADPFCKLSLKDYIPPRSAPISILNETKDAKTLNSIRNLLRSGEQGIHQRTPTYISPISTHYSQSTYVTSEKSSFIVTPEEVRPSPAKGFKTNEFSQDKKNIKFRPPWIDDFASIGGTPNLEKDKPSVPTKDEKFPKKSILKQPSTKDGKEKKANTLAKAALDLLSERLHKGIKRDMPKKKVVQSPKKGIEVCVHPVISPLILDEIQEAYNRRPFTALKKADSDEKLQDGNNTCGDKQDCRNYQFMNDQVSYDEAGDRGSLPYPNYYPEASCNPNQEISFLETSIQHMLFQESILPEHLRTKKRRSKFMTRDNELNPAVTMQNEYLMALENSHRPELITEWTNSGPSYVVRYDHDYSAS